MDAVPLKAKMNQSPQFLDKTKSDELKQETENEDNLNTEMQQQQQQQEVKTEVTTN